VALRREGALARTGQAQGRGASGSGFNCRKTRAPAVSQRHPLVAGAHLARAFVGDHSSSSLRECFAIFSTRLLCIMSHISDPKRSFPPPKSRCGNFFQPFPFWR
jgi:hypothetical protein